VTKQQHLLMQIRPGTALQRDLILEAMDCVVIKNSTSSFSKKNRHLPGLQQICTGIARFLVVVLGSAPMTPRPEMLATARQRIGSAAAEGMWEQSA
jgi:hypothetical protein